MSTKLFIATFLAVICLCHAGSKVSTEVKSAGSLRTASRQDDDIGDFGGDFSDSEFGDESGDFGGDFGDDSGMGMDDFAPEPEPEVKSAPPPAPKPTKKPEPKPVKPESVPAPKLHMEYTTKYPTNCPCMLSKGTNNGVCYEFTSGKQCKGRPCKPSYVCIDGPAPKKAVTCIRKKNTKQVVSNGDGTCKVKSISAYGYTPYSSGR